MAERLWCRKCKAEMAEVNDIKLTLSFVPLPNATGLRCPSCGVELLRKELILGDLAAAEKMLHGK